MKRAQTAIALGLVLLLVAAAIYGNAYRFLDVMPYDVWYANAHLVVAGGIALLSTGLRLWAPQQTVDQGLLMPPGQALTRTGFNRAGTILLAVATAGYLAFAMIGLLVEGAPPVQAFAMLGAVVFLILVGFALAYPKS